MTSLAGPRREIGLTEETPSSSEAAPESTSTSENLTPGPARGEGVALRGDLSEIAAADVVQLMSLLRKTGTLIMSSRGTHTSIFIEDGAVVHAQNGTLRGAAAVFHAFQWSEGTFAFVAGQRTAERSIALSTEALLLKAAVVQDNTGRDSDLVAEPDADEGPASAWDVLRTMAGRARQGY